MATEIDQSGKVEYTSHTTAIADSSGNSVIVTKSTKRTIQLAFRQANRPRLFVYETFCAAIAILISKSFSPEQSYLIDTEYPGKSDLLKGLVLKFCRKLGLKIQTSQISFGRISKNSIADSTAHTEFVMAKVSSKLTAEQVLSLVLA